MVQIGELSASITPLNINQMTRWVNTKEEHAGKIISLMSEYCLCQRVKPVSDPKTPFASEADYIAALQSHHQVMLAAVKCKQNVDPALADALDGAVAEMSKMRTWVSATLARMILGASLTRPVGAGEIFSDGSKQGAQVFIGNQTASVQRDILRQNGITHVVNCTSDMANAFQGKDGSIAYFRFDLYKFFSALDLRSHRGVYEFFVPVFQWIDEAVESGPTRRGLVAMLLFLRAELFSVCL
ncbi:lip-1 [Symbiodinium sp. CCMP2592]|nr:lip-1 [Symbiodinium sp. CCMP2592]